MWMLRSWVPFMKKSGKNHGYPLSYQGFFTAAAPNYEGWWPVDPPGRKKTLLSVGWILKKLQVGRMIPGDLTQIHHEFNEFFCAGFNNRHDLFMFIFYIFFFTFLPLIFFIWQNVTTMYGTWLARQMEHLQRNISVWVAVVPKILDLVISIAALGIEGCVEVWKCIYVDFEFWESIWVERSQVNTIS